MGSTFTVPSAYAPGYEKARELDPDTADKYVRHTTIGDAELDPVMEELASMPIQDLHRFIGAGIEQEKEVFRSAPEALRNFFDTVNAPPPWVEFEAFEPAVRAFYIHVTNMLVAFVTGVLIEGFTTLISKSFNITGRVVYGPGDRRLRQNNRHLMEIFFPGGMLRDGDGWKTTMRVRIVHARVRQLMKDCKDWDTEAWGTPISAAHIGFSSVVFSMRLLQHSMKVGSKFTAAEKESVMRLWRYVGWLMGVPETILFTDRDDARQLFEIGYMCEPPPSLDSVIMANSLVNAIPVVAGIESQKEQAVVKNLAYGISRALIGNKLAGQLQFPRKSKLNTFFKWRSLQAIGRMRKQKGSVRSENFVQLLNIAQYDEIGNSYKLPDHVYSSKSIDW